MSEKFAICAGIIMGEGNIAIQKCKNGKYTIYQPRLSVVNTDRSLVKFVVDSIGGLLVPKPLSHAQKHKKWKPCFRSCLSGFKLLPALELIEPYIVSPKWRKRIKITRDYIVSRQLALKEKGRKLAHYTEIEFKMIDRLKELNRKGRP